MQTGLHWFYVGTMLLGALLFFIWSRDPRGVPRYEYLIAIFIPLWSGAAYLAMALGQGTIAVDGQTTYYARYLDWVVTTPLLVVALAMTGFYKKKPDITLIAALIGADVFMIVSGLIADLSPEPIRFVWYGVGVAAFVVLLLLVWVTLRGRVQQEQEAPVYTVFVRAATYLTIMWIGYPLIWLLGPSGVGVIDQNADVLLFVILPILSKVGFSIYGLSMLRDLESVPGKGGVQGAVTR